MLNYTTVLQRPLEDISWEDDNFIEELLEVVQLFRPFSVAITEFITEQGYSGEAETACETRYSISNLLCFLPGRC